MIEAMSILVGCAALMRVMRGTHQSSGLVEMSSQFHDECRAASEILRIVTSLVAALVRKNLVFGPATLTTGCRPMVFVTTPPHPASKARRMLLSDSVGGAEESRNGFSKRRPVKTVERSGMAEGAVGGGQGARRTGIRTGTSQQPKAVSQGLNHDIQFVPAS